MLEGSTFRIQLTLEQHEFDYIGPLICGISSIHTQLALCIILVSCMRIQPTVDWKQYFQSRVGNSQMWSADWMHCSTPFYIRDLSNLRFWLSTGVLELIPHGYWGNACIKFLTWDFQFMGLCWEVHIPCS